MFYKNHEILFNAFSLIDKKLSVRIVLYLSLKKDFNSLYSFENIEIISVGQIPHEDMYEWYSKMDALVFPSYIETLGLPLIEAASLGIPLIASDLPYSREVLNGYEGSKYVNHTDAEDWGNVLLNLASTPKIRYSPFRRENKNSWNSLFQIIKRKI
jgi:glycosyltransferase involved in cell wall biosynthesis